MVAYPAMNSRERVADAVADRVVMTMKWGDAFAAEEVNVLMTAARANLVGPARFVCLTDRTEGLADFIETYPIPDPQLDQRYWNRGAWPKLTTFSKELFGLSGRALFIDIDTVIWDNIDPFFERRGALICLNSTPWRNRPGPPRAGTGIYAFDIGASFAVVDHFQANKAKILAAERNEQEYLHSVFERVTGRPIVFWPDEWIRSFKRHQRQPLVFDRFLHPRPPGDGVRILCFHGIPRPLALIRPKKGNYDRFPHYGSGQVDWMVDYWTRYGGTV